MEPQPSSCKVSAAQASQPRQGSVGRQDSLIMDQEQQLREDEIKAVKKYLKMIRVNYYGIDLQARESLSVEKLREYKDIFSFFDK